MRKGYWARCTAISRRFLSSKTNRWPWGGDILRPRGYTAAMASCFFLAAALGTGFVLVASPARAANDEFSYARLYSTGEARRYAVERRVYNDNIETYAVRGITIHSVDDPSRGETIRFEKLAKYADEMPIDLTKEALKFSGFIVFVSSDTPDAAGLAIPEMKDVNSSVAGLVADLRTVHLAVSPFAGVNRLHRVGDSYTQPQPVSLSRNGGAAMSVSEDCLELKLVLTGLTPFEAVLRATFSPPAVPCHPPRAPGLNKPVDSDGSPNNVWQVSRTGGTYRVRWGKETAVVNVTLDRKTGALLAAELDDVRLINERRRCDANFNGCAPGTQSIRRRSLQITAR